MLASTCNLFPSSKFLFYHFRTEKEKKKIGQINMKETKVSMEKNAAVNYKQKSMKVLHKARIWLRKKICTYIKKDKAKGS